jgi:O-antigen ligase
MMFFTQSRGALVALILGTLVALIGQKKRLRFLLVLSGLAGIVVVSAPDSVWSRIGGLRNIGTSAAELQQVDPEGSAMQRYELWKVAMEVYRTNPITGVGIGAYKLVHREIAPQSQFATYARGSRDTHSTYLNVLAETGIVGIVTFLSVFVAAIVRAERARRRVRVVNPGRERQIFFLELGLLGLGLSAIFGTYVLIPFTYLFPITLYALAGVAEQETRAAAWGPAAVASRRR